jgi:hypothetical protein
VLGAASPTAALNADAAYIRALQAAARGDLAGARAAAEDAQARALQPGSGSAAIAPLPLPALPLPAGPAGHPSEFAPTGTVPNAHDVPIVSAGAASDPDLGVAENEIEIAHDAGASDAALARAKAHYRSALDAYYDGNAKRASAEARTALDLATDAITAPK